MSTGNCDLHAEWIKGLLAKDNKGIYQEILAEMVESAMAGTNLQYTLKHHVLVVNTKGVMLMERHAGSRVGAKAVSLQTFEYAAHLVWMARTDGRP